MKPIILTATLVSASITVSAQTRIEGVYKDSINNETEPYATVRVFKQGKMDKPVAMSLTGANGEISQFVEDKGNFTMTISSVGKKTVRRELTLNGEPTLKLGNVYTTDATKELGEVQVISQKPIVKMEADKMTYNIQDDADSKTLTVLDMLRKVPMVTVDAQDNITVNGSSSFKILVDGKPNIQMQNNAKTIFKTLPASYVEKIEVNTNPGAKYDAEGVGGVLNLVLVHQGGNGKSVDTDGYSGELAARISNYGLFGSAYITGQKKKWSYSLNLYSGNNDLDNITLDDNRIQYGTPNSIIYTHADVTDKNPFRSASMNIGYDADSLNVINVSAGVNYYNGKQVCDEMTSLTGGTYGSGFSYTFDATSRNKDFGVNASADWQHFFNKDHTHNITFSYQFERNPSRAKDTRIYKDITGTSVFDLNNSLSDNYTVVSEHTAQADYTVPMSESQTLNAGAKYIYRNNHADANYYMLNTNGEQYGDPASSLLYDNRQQIVAGYAEHVGSYGNWSSREGLRYEHTFENIEYPNLPEQNFKKNYGNLVPSATLSYHLSQQANLGLTYSLRILRPGISYLNPYYDPSDATSVSYGNPDLDVERAQYINLVFNFYAQRFMMNATFSQSFCNNQIEEYSFTDATGKMNTTYGNNVKNRWTNFNTWMRWVAGKNTSISLNGYVGYGDIRSAQLNERNHGWQGSATLSLEQNLPWKIKWNLGLQAMTKMYNLQGYEGGMAFGYTVFTRTFCKDRLTLSLVGMSPLAEKLEQKTYKQTAQFNDDYLVKVGIRKIQFGISWKFGNTNKQFKEHESKISSDFGEGESKSQKASGLGDM